MSLPRSDIRSEPQELVEVLPVEPDPMMEYPDLYVPRLIVDVIHDGDWIPEEFLADRLGQRVTFEQLEENYVRERDWGACVLAERLAARLGLDSFTCVNVARVLMDFGRFPGSTPRHADHLHRFAINYPFSKLLSHYQKKRLLEGYYDRVSDRLEQLLAGKLVKIAVHTYDPLNESGTERPPVSIMTRSIGYQTQSEMPAGLFDPLYPDVLGEFTADRILRDRISLHLEKAKVPVAHNYPYCLPEGSLEVRYQVWSYFRFLRHIFEQTFPATVGDASYEMVWQMLLDTNRRNTESDGLRGYLHLYRRPPPERAELFEAAEKAYEHLFDFARESNSELVDSYRFSPERPSSIAIDVRKDVVCELGRNGRPIAVRWDNVHRIADHIAAAVATYLVEDRLIFSTEPHDELERIGTWYTPPRD